MQQPSTHQEKSPHHQVGTAEGSRRGWSIWDSVLSLKALAPTRRTIAKGEKEEEMFPVASHRSRDGDLITAQQSRRCTGQPAPPPASAPPVRPALSAGCHPGTQKPSPGAPPGWQNNTALSSGPPPESCPPPGPALLRAAGSAQSPSPPWQPRRARDRCSEQGLCAVLWGFPFEPALQMSN